jgi:hypothetical protein
MRDRPELALAGVVALGLLVLIVAGLVDRRDEAFTLGVRAGGVAADLRPGQRACQERIDVPEEFNAVELQVGTYRRAGPRLDVSVHEGGAGGPVLGEGSLAPGYPDVSRPRIEVGSIPAGGRVAVCIENAGDRRVALYGNAGIAAPSSTLRVRGRTVDNDLTLVFHTDGKRSLLGELPDMFQRAALFKAGWVGAWTFWLLTLAVVGLVPLAVAFAVRSLGRDGGG